MANTASSALPFPAQDAASQHEAVSESRPALAFTPSTKFSALPLAHPASEPLHDSDEGASDSDDLATSQEDKVRERLYRDRARDAIKKEQVHMEGFLYKKSGGAASKAWNKRWCVLRSQAFLIYKRFSEDKLKRIIRADEIVDVRRVERRNHSFAFEIETPDRTFFFDASSEQELDTWLSRLRTVVASVNDGNAANSCYSGNRLSGESRADSRKLSNDSTAGSVFRAQFATTSKATAPTKDAVSPDAFLSLQPAAHRTQTASRPANSVFPPEEVVIGASNENHDENSHQHSDAKDGQTLLERPASLSADHENSGRNLPVTVTSTLGLQIETSQTLAQRYMAQVQFTADAEPTTAFPPGIDPGHEPAPITEEYAEDTGNADVEEDEEPNFNVDQRREIETRLVEDRVILRGYLLKQDKLRQWRRRWFVLRQNTLSYYADDREYEIKQILRRHEIHDIRGPDPSTAKAKSLRRTYFKVVAEKRNYWLAHDDAVKAREWFNALIQWKDSSSASAPTATTLLLPVAIRQSVSAQTPVALNDGISSKTVQRVQSASTSPQQMQTQVLSPLGIRRKGSNLIKDA
ncbi:hypothetical protein BX070DRAFT_232875 [Coemansia spiralis]|nr:hypothetical protein BX070DRAFT_232875 [Coemansia spiralis]